MTKQKIAASQVMDSRDKRQWRWMVASHQIERRRWRGWDGCHPE